MPRTQPGSATTPSLETSSPNNAADPDVDLPLVGGELVADSLGEYLRGWAKRIRSGENSILPVLLGLLIIVIIFWTQSSVFLSAGNLTDLLVQGATYVLLGMAEVYVLLLGEIDLSAGYVAAVGGVVAVVLSTAPYNWPWWAAILAGLAATALIGAVQGLLITRLGLPSFVVTLAGLLGFEGALIFLVDHYARSSGGTITITNNIISDLVSGNISPVAGWIILAVAAVIYAVLSLLRDRHRRASGLVAPPRALTVAKIVLVAAAGVVLVAVCNTDRGTALVSVRGVPWVVLIVIGVLAGWTFLLGRTRFGRYVYAIGGNAEAARRAGVSLMRIRLLCFTLCSLTAGLAGILYASRLGSISNDVDGGGLVLDAVAAAVIGGTSLFGGKGKMVHALLGGLVIATIDNGLELLSISTAVQEMVTALVLLAAVAIGAVSTRGRSAT